MEHNPAALDAARRLRDRADDVRVEAKSIMRKARVLGQMAAALEEEADELENALDVARPSVK